MDAQAIRTRMDEVMAKVPRWSHNHDREAFVEAVYCEVDCWVEAGRTGLWFDHYEGTRRYSPPCGYLLEEDYRFFDMTFGNELIDKLRLARAFVESVMMICCHDNSIWRGWAVNSLGRELPDLLASESPEDIVARAIDTLAARNKGAEVTTEQTKIFRRRSEATEARDRFIYDGYIKNVKLSNIRFEVAQVQSWTLLETDSAVLRAAVRYARRHGLPTPRSGQAHAI